MENIEKSCKEELEEIFKDADTHNCGKPMRETWENDKRNAKAHFFQDQATNSKYTHA